MSLEGLSKEEAFMHGWEVATQRAISRAELGLPLEYGKTPSEIADEIEAHIATTYPEVEALGGALTDKIVADGGPPHTAD